MDEILAEEYLLQIPMWTKKKNSLADIRLFLKEMGNPQEEFSVIHVAGTNGKGSVCAFLDSMLRAQGVRVGSFTSPHLVDVKERISIDGTMADSRLFQACFREVCQVTERMTAQGYCHPSFFEYLFYMAMAAFRSSGVRYAILETGLGGRIDITNVISRPLVTVITSISLDHMEYLGDTIEKIAGEKAGIIKPGCPVIYADSCGGASAVILKRAAELSSPVYPVKRMDYTMGETVCEAPFPQVSFSSLEGERVTVQVPFAAPYQAENMLLAVRAAELLAERKPDWNALRRGIEQTKWPGRMEEVLPGVYLDGAHNIGGIAAFVQAADKLREKTQKRLVLLFAVSADKEYQAMIRILTEELRPDQIVVAHMCNPRGLDIDTLAGVFRERAGCPVESFPDVEKAFDCAMRQKGADGLLFAVGSLYLIGEMKEMIRRYSHD